MFQSSSERKVREKAAACRIDIRHGRPVFLLYDRAVIADRRRYIWSKQVVQVCFDVCRSPGVWLALWLLI